MSISTPLTCALGLTPDDLSAWRDHALAPADERRITAHTGACPTCQRIITADNAISTALHAEQPPAPDPRDWSRLQARISSERSGVFATPALRRVQRPAIWGGLSAAAAVLLISALFFHLFAQQAGRRGGSSHIATATVFATPQPLTAVAPTTPIAGSKLTWRTRAAPESVVPPPGNQMYANGFAFAPTDAQTAYICATTNAINAPITVWATHDGATTWTHVGDLPYLGQVAGCFVTIDALDPMRLTLSVSAQNMTTLKSGFTSAISDDGGKSWRMLGGDEFYVTGLSTTRGVSVAILGPVSFDPLPNQPHPHISVSRDDWKTFQAIDAPLVARGLVVFQVWRRPSDGALLALAIQRPQSRGNLATPAPSAVPNGPPAITLWQSDDLGAHWTQLPTPPNMLNLNTLLVAQPVGNEPWKACGFIQTGSGATLNQLIGCTLDGGRTWQSRPLPALKQSCGSGCLAQQVVGWDMGALLPDGSLVVPFYTGPTDSNAVQTQSMSHIFRLAPGATQWQDLGSWPDSKLTVIGSAPAGTLVSYNGPGGELIGHLGGDISNRGALDIATLP